MIFLCFSGKDRHTVVQSVLYHLQKYGCSVWYDNHQYILGDNKPENYIEGICSSQYAVLFLSPTFFSSAGVKEEMQIIKARYSQGLIHLFPLLYNISISQLPIDYEWIKDLIYNTVTDTSGTLLSCSQMICKILEDQLCDMPCNSLSDALQFHSLLPSYIVKLLEQYFQIIPQNIDSRLTLLYAVHVYVQTIEALPKEYIFPANYLFQTTKLHLSYNFKEIIIMEQLVCLCINKLLIKNNSLLFEK